MEAKNSKKTSKPSKFANTVSTSMLSNQLIEQYEMLPKKMVKEIVRTFLEQIESGLLSGQKVRIDRIGILAIKNKAARIGRNPQTGAPVQVPESKKVHFRPSLTLKNVLGIKANAAKKAPAKAKVKK